jgi:hypothetical protein
MRIELCKIAKPVHAMILALLCCSAQAQQQVDLNWDWQGGTPGSWTASGDVCSFACANGQLRVGFDGQRTPFPESVEVMTESMQGCMSVTNISFRFMSLDFVPSLLRVGVRSSEGGAVWYRSVQIDKCNTWHEFDIPVAFSGDWVKGPGCTLEEFEREMSAVDRVSVHIERHGSPDEQSYAIDSFSISGKTVPGSAGVGGQVKYDGEQEGRMIVLVMRGDQQVATYEIPEGKSRYEIDGLDPLSKYSVHGFCDANTDRAMDTWEAQGGWRPNPLDLGLQRRDNVDIYLTDPLDSTGVALWWIRRYLPDLETDAEGGGIGFEDSDGDGLNNYSEYIAGTHPRDEASVLRISAHPDSRSDAEVTEEGFTISWPSVSNRTYAVWRSSSLAEEFECIATGLNATPPANTYVDTNQSGRGDTAFYRVEVEGPRGQAVDN